MKATFNRSLLVEEAIPLTILLFSVHVSSKKLVTIDFRQQVLVFAESTRDCQTKFCQPSFEGFRSMENIPNNRLCACMSMLS